MTLASHTLRMQKPLGYLDFPSQFLVLDHQKQLTLTRVVQLATFTQSPLPPAICISICGSQKHIPKHITWADNRATPDVPRAPTYALQRVKRTND